ncbi:antifreeze protein [Phaeovulum sp.]|uniref:antifreeze protein n=1 Tax=Phaeovulum sp. TaxID=2934796 RepID=UPI0039E6E3EB
MFDPFAPFALCMDIAKIGMEAQSVVTYRLAGLMGLWDTPPSEVNRMFAEKQRAMVWSVGAAQRAVFAGKSPEAVMRAGLKPIGKRTAANARRLARLGPKNGD